MISLYIKLSNHKIIVMQSTSAVAIGVMDGKGTGYKGMAQGVFVGGDGTAPYSKCGRGFTNLYM